MRLGISIFLLLLLCLPSCKCDKQETLYPSGSELYRYVFRDTSVWIYRNPTTNMRDTVVMYKMERLLIPVDTAEECIDLRKEAFQMQFASTLTGVGGYFWIDYNGIRMNGIGEVYNTGTEIYGRISNPGDSTENTQYIGLYPSMNFENHTYSNVRKYLLLNSSIEFPHKTYLYWAKSLGIVRKEYRKSNGEIEFWDLTDSYLKYYPK